VSISEPFAIRLDLYGYASNVKVLGTESKKNWVDGSNVMVKESVASGEFQPQCERSGTLATFTYMLTSIIVVRLHQSTCAPQSASPR
jgi:hypothetical protein